jgi:hypothetical protein
MSSKISCDKSTGCVKDMPTASPTSETTQDIKKNIDTEIAGQAPDPPPAAFSALERWNYPRKNFWRYIATLFSFFVLGANDAAFGVCN